MLIVDFVNQGGKLGADENLQNELDKDSDELDYFYVKNSWGTGINEFGKSIESDGFYKINLDYFIKSMENSVLGVTLPRNINVKKSSDQTVKKSSDPYIALIDSWDATSINCNSSKNVVKITFEPNKVYCIQPTPEVQAGDYSYDHESEELVLMNAAEPLNTVTPVINSEPIDDGGF